MSEETDRDPNPDPDFDDPDEADCPKRMSGAGETVRSTVVGEIARFLRLLEPDDCS